MKELLLKHALTVIGVFLTPFIAGLLKAWVVDPFISLILYVGKRAAKFLWNALVLVTLTSLLSNAVPLLVESLHEYLLDNGWYQSWPVETLLAFLQRTAQTALVKWLQEILNHAVPPLENFFLFAKNGIGFVVAQYNKTYHNLFS